MIFKRFHGGGASYINCLIGGDMKKYNLAIVGATGVVGRKFAEVLQKRNFPIGECTLFASSRSAGSELECCDKRLKVVELTPKNVEALSGKLDFALFSAGGAVSEKFAPLFVRAGATVIDNSSQWRQHPDVPLVVPEVNPEDVDWAKGLIANPNCSTIQAAVALKPLEKFGIERVVYSTYQAVSGAGIRGIRDLQNGLKGETALEKFPHPIAGNILPHIDVFLPDGYTKEERKMIDETRKIMHRPDLRVTATTARVPVFNCHCESINVEFGEKCTLDDVREAMNNASGLILLDDPSREVYPMPIDVSGKDDVYVGRLRMDGSVPSGINMWVVADNLLKGAALNAVQIMELCIRRRNDI